MNSMANVVIGVYAVALMAVLLAYTLGGACGKSPQRKLYAVMLVSTMATMTADILSRFDGLSAPLFPALNWCGNLALYLLAPALPSLWVEYVYLQVSGKDGARAGVHAALITLNALNTFMVIATQFTGWYYVIDAANVYHRGPAYPLSHLITVVMIGWAYCVTIRNRHNIDKKVLFSLLFFPVPSTLGIVLQLVFYGYAFALLASVLSLLVVLLYAQDDSIYTDFLTGVGNRKKLEAVLKEKIAKSSPRRTFSFVMLDIDHFKQINDTLGHEAGDQVLKTAASLLKRCVRASDYVTRYGGDEFCLILDVSSEAGVARVNERIRSALNALKQAGTLPCPLSFSMGHAVYDFEERLTAEALLKRVDARMYEDKRRKTAEA